MFAWPSQRASGYEKDAVSMPQYAMGAWNGFLGSRKVFAKSQTRLQLREFIAKNPQRIVSLPDGRKPQKRG